MLSDRSYYLEGADEITFLNITAFRDETLADMPLMDVLEKASEQIFVPLCIGGGIRDYTDKAGTEYTALEVAAAYFRSGADKISLGSDAVLIAEAYFNGDCAKNGTTAVETISYTYGAQVELPACAHSHARPSYRHMRACGHDLHAILLCAGRRHLG